MAYYLGIDLGTTYTAAAAERDGVVEALTLGNRTASVPSVVFLRDDGEILVGETATRRATSDPGRVAREFKRRVGDPTPIILGGTPYAAEMLMARLLRWSVDRVREQQGEDPRAIALTHPANWGPYKLDLFTQAVRQVDLDAALLLAEPVAAATFYASQRSLSPGSVVAVYDLGGGTFDAAVVRRNAQGFEMVGTPEGMERLGGIDFDEAVFAHVRNAVGDGLDRLDPEEPAAQAAVARLRQECIDAKEALSSDTDVSIPVLLPGLQTEVRLTRSEFEAMIRPAISETIVALRRAIRSASVSADDISAVLLVGGSSRIPLVAQMVGAELGRPIAIDAHPKDAIAFGAAIAVAEKRGATTPESVTTVLADTRPPPPTVSSDATRRPAPPTAAGMAAAAGAVRPPAPAPRPARPAPPGATGAARPGGAAPQSGAPVGPGAPVTGAPLAAPGQPSGPPRPGAPGQPSGSTRAADPGQPSGPARPGTPGQPAGPSRPGGGGQPSGPTRPVAPGQPPVTGERSGARGQQTAPSRPAAPGQQAVSPAARTAPSTPTPPARPGGATPTGGATPIGGATPTGPGTTARTPAGPSPSPGGAPAGPARGTVPQGRPGTAAGGPSGERPVPPSAPGGRAAAPSSPGGPGRGAAPAAGGARGFAAPAGSAGRPAQPTSGGYQPYAAPSGGGPYGGMPRAGGTPVGGHSSGSYPAMPVRSGGAADNKALWIVLAVVAAIALIVIIVVALSGGGDESGNGSGGSGSSGGSGEPDSGFTDAVETEFLSSCTSTGGTEAACGCAWDEITASMTFERFSEIEADLAEDPDLEVPELTAIIDQCSGAT